MKTSTLTFDQRLEKKLKGKSSFQFPDANDIQNILSRLLSNYNVLITGPPGSGKTSLALSVIQSNLDHFSSIWYINSSHSFIDHHLFSLNSALTIKPIHDDSSLASNQPTLYLCHPHNVLSPNISYPDLIIIDDFEYITTSYGSNDIEDMMLSLPDNIPLISILEASTNADEISRWFQNTRYRLCWTFSNFSAPQIIPCFLTSSWDLYPLNEKKRLHSKVKEFIKESKDTHSPASHSFIHPLIHALKKEKLTPALIVMKDLSLCKIAFQACQSINEALFETILVDPTIQNIFHSNPELQNDPEVKSIVNKRAAVFHLDLHPVLMALIQYLIKKDALDIIFTPVQMATYLSVRIKTIVMTTSECFDKEGKSRQISHFEINRIKRLIHPTFQLSGLFILVHTSDMDPIPIKDSLVSPNRLLKSRFKCSCRTVLNCLWRGFDKNRLANTFSVFQNPTTSNVMFEDILMELAAELPDSKCVLPHAPDMLHHYRIKLDFQINALKNKLKTIRHHDNPTFIQQQLTQLESMHHALPCNQCDYFTKCHQRSSKQFRIMMEDYQSLGKQLMGSFILIESRFEYYTKHMIEANLIDSYGKITNEGRLALQSGLHYPQILMACVKFILQQGDPIIKTALFAGFASIPEKIEKGTLSDDPTSQSIQTIYDNMLPCIEASEELLLRYGLILDRPNESHSHIMIAIQQGALPETIAKEMGISVHSIRQIIDQTKHFVSVFI